mmetsp:Transcript_2118/g.6318  ORF Transcript_2118/g.6318 Transcript_2118/m.6318 type:complete len:194 (+) Transcript_2118:265-846(+)
MVRSSAALVAIALLVCHSSAGSLPRLRKYAVARQISNIEPAADSVLELNEQNADDVLRVFLAHTVLLEGDAIRDGHVLDSSKGTADMVVKAAIDNDITVCEQILALSSQAFMRYPVEERTRALTFVDNELDKLPSRMLVRMTQRLVSYRNAEQATMKKARAAFDSRSLFTYADHQLSRAVSELRSLTMDQFTM